MIDWVNYSFFEVLSKVQMFGIRLLFMPVKLSLLSLLYLTTKVSKKKIPIQD